MPMLTWSGLGMTAAAVAAGAVVGKDRKWSLLLLSLLPLLSSYAKLQTDFYIIMYTFYRALATIHDHSIVQ
jgi:hypothetical protein